MVLGAGLAGLVAADRLRAGGADVLVCEADERVGGRLLSQPIGGGEQVEMGGQWVGPGQDRVLALVRELGLELFPTHTAGDNLVLAGRSPRRYRGTIPRLGPHVLADLGWLRLRLARVARRVPSERPWAAPRAAALDSLSLGAWLARNARTQSARRLVAVSCRTVWGAEPEELSLLWVLGYVRAAGSFDALLDVEGGAQQDRVVGGSQLLALRLAERLAERVLTGAPVERVAWSRAGVEVSGGGWAIAARRAIVALPPGPLRAVRFEPALPAEHARCAARFAGGRLVKLAAVYDEPFWRADGLSGEAVSAEGPVTITFDNSPPTGTPGVLTAFVGGADVPAFASLGPAERRHAATTGLARLFGRAALRPALYLERDWGAQPWAQGGPVANLAAGHARPLTRVLCEPVGPLAWAGAERAPRWRGYMDGAVRSGEDAAALTLARL